MYEIQFNRDEVFKDVDDAFKAYKAEIRKNLQDACAEAIRVAKETTPPQGEARGSNTVTGALADHWQHHITENSDGTYNIEFSNDMQYASFVNNGHRMKEHFVPWLYIDESGLLSRYQPVSGEKVFGLIVGTKTKHVKGANMLEKAEKRFNEVFEQLMKATNKKFRLYEGQYSYGEPVPEDEL